MKTLGDVSRNLRVGSLAFPLEAARRSLLESGSEGDQEGQERGNEPYRRGRSMVTGATWS